MIKTQLLTKHNWHDFVSLMESDSQCSECWCLNHRQPAGCSTGDAAKKLMNLLVEQEKVGGLLAYLSDKCVGWISIDPMGELVGHDCYDKSQTGEWSIHCLFVKKEFRGKGVSSVLIQSGIEFAKSKGASKISAFPIPMENSRKFPAHEAEFSGRYSSYTKNGFKPIGESSDFYQKVELELNK